MEKYEIHYQSTLEEAIDALYRLAKHMGYQKKQLMISLTAPFVMSGLLFILLDSSLKYILIATAFVASSLAILLSFKPMMMKQLRKSAIQIRGTDQSLDSVFILENDGILFQQGGQQLKTAWSNIIQLLEDDHYIEMIATGPLVCILIPKTAIPEQEIDNWRTFIKQKSPVS